MHPGHIDCHFKTTDQMAHQNEHFRDLRGGLELQNVQRQLHVLDIDHLSSASGGGWAKRAAGARQAVVFQMLRV